MLAAPCDAKKPSVGNKQEQSAFTQKYFEMKAKGGQEFKDWKQSVQMDQSGKDAEERFNMLNNLEGDKTADGKPKSPEQLEADKQRLQEIKKKQGFMGDPTDKGPQDWSDYNIETDANGNVTGFKEKDFEEKDKDKDGEISDEERAEWDAKKKKEHDEAGGAPGEVPPIADWDKDGDGKPDPGFERDCWQCKKPPEDLHECVDGALGPCDSHACDQDQEECVEHVETHGGKEYRCHNCVPKKEKPFCEACGFSSDPNCGGECRQGPCVPIDLNKESCDVIPTAQTRERGSTQQCYTCMRVTTIEVTWVIIIVETPFERFVLGKANPLDAFKPASVMALAKVDKASGMIQNTVGQYKAVTDFLGGFNVGLGPMGMTTTGKMSMDQLSGLLGSKLSGGGSYGSDCFGDVVDEADKQAEAEGMPTSQDIGGTGKARKADKKKGESENINEEQLKKADQAGSPAVTGPIVACGNEGRNKVLRIYDASGALVDTITQAMFKANPGIITEKLGAAQQLTDIFIQKSGIDFSSYIEKFTGLPLKDMQSYAAKVSQIKSRVDQAVGVAASQKKKKGQKEEEPRIIIPNDPLYLSPDAGKKKSAVKERMKKIAASPLGTGMRMGGGEVGAGSDDPLEEMRKAKAEAVQDQWSLRKIGFTDESDPNSAWNVVEASEKNVVVAVIDSGLDTTHPDGPQYLWTNPKETPDNGIDDDKNGFVDDIHGWNFLNENHDFTDVRGHGTFVAGIIAAKSNNGIGIAGINPGAVIMPVKVADDEGVTNSLNIYRGINYAVNHGAKIINVSLGSRSVSKLEQQAIERASAMGALVFIAAGNSNDNLMEFGPASSKHGLAVGQIDMSGVRSTVSNWGPNLGLVAPGEQILSLCSKDNKHVLPSIRKEGYYRQDGTSFATPMVAATASLIWAKNPNLTHQQVADMIRMTATDMNEPGWDGMTGHGLLNAASALRADADEKLVLMFTTLRLNRDIHDKVISVDVFGTARGQFKEFFVEIGKGKNPGQFEAVAGPLSEPHIHQHIARINVQKSLRGSKDWVFRIRAVDQSGAERIASTPFSLPK
ncbi:MAG: S8 family peptidase [Candidatus Omnitrophota bacterium]|nr:S8 family peptidase [Candidatus Omnitrophota bacterium]